VSPTERDAEADLQGAGMKPARQDRKSSLRIGGASGFWGDAALATPQLLRAGDLDFIVYDYLAEITMAILARARAKDAALGYATDFVTQAMAPNLAAIARQGVRIIANAGGVNPQGCARALRAEIARLELTLKVAVVSGDDLMPRLDSLAAGAPADMFSGAPFPDTQSIASANAYLGAFPIAAALDGGADIVLTGRCVDSAVTLGACIHAFGWGAGDLDALAQGSLAGHILECGPQATGGNFTDWRDVGDMADIGYPIAEMGRDGDFVLSKPGGTGGRISCATIAEQMLYEIGDPQTYELPDVTCDFSRVTLRDLGGNRVRVSGARGRGVPGAYKSCLTWKNGYRGGHLFGFYGLQAEAKAQAFATAALKRARASLARMNTVGFTETSVEILGAESQFGDLRQSGAAREVVLKLAARHPQALGITALLQEATGLGLAGPPGLSGFAGTRPRPSPVLALFSCLTPKSDIAVRISDAAGTRDFVPAAAPLEAPPPSRPATPPALRRGKMTEVALIDLAWARSGDKGDMANIGVIARHPDYLPCLWHGLDEAHLRRVFGHVLQGRVARFLLPGTASLNILLHGVLGGGGTSSLRNDPQGKGFAQLLLAAPLRINADLLKASR
jgi:Acyclic terpene utilisation family protein AtuA